MRRLWFRIRWGRPCGDVPPYRLLDARPCIMGSRSGAHEWHFDGLGYIWNDTHWRWMGPVVSLAETGYLDPPSGTNFTETESTT